MIVIVEQRVINRRRSGSGSGRSGRIDKLGNEEVEEVYNKLGIEEVEEVEEVTK